MNDRKKLKKYLPLLAAAIAALSLTACGQQEIVSESEAAQSVESVAQTETVEVEISETIAESETESVEEVPALTEEEIFWVDKAAALSGKYDLTAALTTRALKDICEPYFTLGVGINGSTLENQTLNSVEYMTVAGKHFNSCTMTNLMKSGYILDQKGSQSSEDGMPVLNFASIDPTLAWCAENGMKMRGHTLVWHAQAPDWFFRVDYDSDKAFVGREVMLARMESYIAQLLTHCQTEYPGVIYCWDVVNEAVDPDKGDKDSYFRCRMENDGQTNPWYATIGEDYVEMAFTYARQYADPEVKLFYNDFNTYMLTKTNAIYALCENLKSKGLIDGIGMQGYWGLDYPAINTIEVAIKKFAQLELEIHITELSIDVPEETEEQFEKQGKVYGRVFNMLRSLDTASGGPANITNVTLFGLIDHYREGDTTNTRIFDKNYQPKPAFDKIKAVMERQ